VVPEIYDLDKDWPGELDAPDDAGWRGRETARIWSEPCMSCLGVHFALLPEEVAALEAIDDEGGRLEHLRNEIEVRYFESASDYLAQSDKSWDAMHRTLADGELTWEGGDYPLNHTVLAGKLLYTGDDYILSLKTPAQVKDVAAVLAGLDEVEFRRRYARIDIASYDGQVGDEDFGYTWDRFQDERRLYQRAAAEDRHVLFTADQ